MLVLYNLLFFIYTVLGLVSTVFYQLICFMPVLQLINTMIITNFTYRYYRVARIMYVLYTQDPETRVRALTPIDMQRQKYYIRGVVFAILFAQMLGSLLTIWGNIDSDVHTDWDWDTKKIYISAIVFRQVSEVLSFTLQIYSLYLIFKVAKANERKFKETACTQMAYLFIFSTQLIISVIIDAQ